MQPNPQQEQQGTPPVPPATTEVIQGLKEKCQKAPKHGVNGKYLIIQAARLLAQQEQARKAGSSDAGERYCWLPLTAWPNTSFTSAVHALRAYHAAQDAAAPEQVLMSC